MTRENIKSKIMKKKYEKPIVEIIYIDDGENIFKENKE